MKKLFILLALAGLGFAACDDTGEENPILNKFSYDGTDYSIAIATMEYYGDYYGTDGVSENVDLLLTDADKLRGFLLYMNIPAGNNGKKLTAGTYQYNTSGTSYPANTFVGGMSLDGDETHVEITGGTVTVTLTGGIYTLAINCTLEDGKSLRGNYIGTFEYSDETGSATPTGNQLIYDENSAYNITSAHGEYYGKMDDGANSELIEFALRDWNDAPLFSCEINVPEGNKTLVTGTYFYDKIGDSYAANTFALASAHVGGQDLDVTSGTMIVTTDTSGYYVTFQCTLENGKQIEGYYTGSVTVTDETVE